MWETSQLVNTTPPVITKSNMSLWTMGNMAILCESHCDSSCCLLAYFKACNAASGLLAWLRSAQQGFPRIFFIAQTSSHELHTTLPP
jgi:hypothetical protein